MMQGVHLGWLHCLIYEKLNAHPVKIPTLENIADLFTKRISNPELFDKLVRVMGVKPIT